MAFSVNSLIVSSGPDIYYSDKWFRQIEDHILRLRTSTNTELVEVLPYIAYRNLGDIAGLLNDLRIPQEKHRIVARVNLWDKNEDVVDVKIVLVPSDADIELLRKLLPSS